MKLDGRTVAMAFALTLAALAIAYAATKQEILNKVYDSGTTSLRVLGV